MPVVFRSGRYRFFFFSNERNEPVHIHVASDDQYAKYWVDPVDLAGSGGYRVDELKEIRNLVIVNRELILRRWNEHFGH